LAQYKMLITIPYQTSTMKMYENLARMFFFHNTFVDGVVTIVPTPRFLKIMLEWEGYELNAIRRCVAVGEGWEQFIEFYNDDLKVSFANLIRLGLLLYV
jgi:hypothetical protein